MRSIWNNSFHTKPPALCWTYEVVFNDLIKPVYGVLNDYSQCLTDAVVSITIPDRETETESVYYGGLEFPLYTRHKNAGTFTIKFNENALYEASEALDALYTAYAFNKDYLYCKGNEEKNIGYRHDLYPDYISIITVNIFDPELVTLVQGNEGAIDKKAIARVIRFEDCKILSIGGFTLDYESTDTITREVTFSYTKMIDGYKEPEEEYDTNNNSNSNGSPSEDSKGDGSNEQTVASDKSPADVAADAKNVAEGAASKAEESAAKAETAAESSKEAASSAKESEKTSAEAATAAKEAKTEEDKQKAVTEAENAADNAKAAADDAENAANDADKAAADAKQQEKSAKSAANRAKAQVDKAAEDSKKQAAADAEAARAASAKAAALSSKAMAAAYEAGKAYGEAREAEAKASANASAAKRS